MMKKEISVKTDMGIIECKYSVSDFIDGHETINNSLRRMRELLEATYPRKMLKNIKYELYVYESEEINAFAKKEEDGYVIAFASAVFLKLYQKAKQLFFEENIRTWFGVSWENRIEGTNAIYDYMTWFIAYHELFHIVNGHCGYCDLKNTYIVEETKADDVKDNFLSQILEFDADYSAITACVKYIFAIIINQGIFSADVDETRKEYLLQESKKELLYLGFAVYQVFLLFSEKENGDVSEVVNNLLKYDHPYASIRMAYTSMTMINQMLLFLSLDEIKELFWEISEICIEYDRIYYAKEEFDKSLAALAFTKNGVQHIMLLHNGWNDLVDILDPHAYIKLEKKEELDEAYYWVNDDGTMIGINGK